MPRESSVGISNKVGIGTNKHLLAERRRSLNGRGKLSTAFTARMACLYADSVTCSVLDADAGLSAGQGVLTPDGVWPPVKGDAIPGSGNRDDPSALVPLSQGLRAISS